MRAAWVSAMRTVKGASPDLFDADPLASSFSLYPVIRASPWRLTMSLSLGLVRWEPDSVSGEFPPEWTGESDLASGCRSG